MKVLLFLFVILYPGASAVMAINAMFAHDKLSLTIEVSEDQLRYRVIMKAFEEVTYDASRFQPVKMFGPKGAVAFLKDGAGNDMWTWNHGGYNSIETYSGDITYRPEVKTLFPSEPYYSPWYEISDLMRSIHLLYDKKQLSGWSKIQTKFKVILEPDKNLLKIITEDGQTRVEYVAGYEPKYDYIEVRTSWIDVTNELRSKLGIEEIEK